LIKIARFLVRTSLRTKFSALLARIHPRSKDRGSHACEQEFLAFRRLKSERQLIDRREAAKLLAVTVRTLRRWHEEHRGPPAVLFRRQKFYSLPDILEHLKEKEQRRKKRSGKRRVTSTASVSEHRLKEFC
jgi:hypothetical protein